MEIHPHNNIIIADLHSACIVASAAAVLCMPTKSSSNIYYEVYDAIDDLVGFLHAGQMASYYNFLLPL